MNEDPPKSAFAAPAALPSPLYSAPAAAGVPHVYRGRFDGDAGALFWMKFLNQLLVSFTAGIYAAWGRAKVLYFFRQCAEFGGWHFHFTGTAGEILRGYVRALALVVVALLGLIITMAIIEPLGPVAILATQVTFCVGLMYLLQLAYFSSQRYRLARTTLKDIPFRLAASPRALAAEAFENLLLAIATLGILFPRYYHRRFVALHKRIWFGCEPLRYVGKESDFLRLTSPSFLLVPLTLGLYWLWWFPRAHAYLVSHLEIGGSSFTFETSPGDYAQFVVGNILIIGLTLGLGKPWVDMRTARFFIERTRLEGPFDLRTAGRIALHGAGAGAGEGLLGVLDADADFGI